MRSSNEPKHQFRLNGGILETILGEKKHPSRSALLWNNPVYGTRYRQTVMAKEHFHVQNPLLYLYPEMLDELRKYVFIPPKLADGYRAHLANIKSNPDTRP